MEIVGIYPYCILLIVASREDQNPGFLEEIRILINCQDCDALQSV
jgi:hypothetical protein